MVVTKTKATILLCYLLAFAAGTVTGLVWSLPGELASGRASRPFGLDVTPEQNQQMQEIWTETVGATMRQCEEDRRRIIEERDAAVRELLGEEKQTQYDQIHERFLERMAELKSRRRQAFDTASERTRQILTESQREKFDEMIERRREHVKRHGRPWPPPPWARPSKEGRFDQPLQEGPMKRQPSDGDAIDRESPEKESTGTGPVEGDTQHPPKGGW